MSETVLSIDTLEDCRAAREAAKGLSGPARSYILSQIADVEAKLIADQMAKRPPVVGSRVLYRGCLVHGASADDWAAIVTKVSQPYVPGDSIHLTVFPPGFPPKTEAACQDQTGKTPGTWRW